MPSQQPRACAARCTGRRSEMYSDTSLAHPLCRSEGIGGFDAQDLEAANGVELGTAVGPAERNLHPAAVLVGEGLLKLGERGQADLGQITVRVGQCRWRKPEVMPDLATCEVALSNDKRELVARRTTSTREEFAAF